MKTLSQLRAERPDIAPAVRAVALMTDAIRQAGDGGIETATLYRHLTSYGVNLVATRLVEDLIKKRFKVQKHGTKMFWSPEAEAVLTSLGGFSHD